MTQIKLSPMNPVRIILSVTQVHGGDTWNAIPEKMVIRGSVRTLASDVQDAIQKRMKEVCEGVAVAYGLTVSLDYQKRYPVTVNSETETDVARSVAASLVGSENVLTDFPSAMASEDFGFISQHTPSCYVWIGNGEGEGGCTLHNSRYDFNDASLALGASYWVRLAETLLS